MCFPMHGNGQLSTKFQTFISYTLNLYSAVFQLYLKKTGRKKPFTFSGKVEVSVGYIIQKNFKKYLDTILCYF